MPSPSFSGIFMPGFGFARVRDKAFASVRKLWNVREEQGWTQLDLARRMGKNPAWVSRKLSGPTNWTFRTFGDLTDAMDGEVEIMVRDLQGTQDLTNYDAYSDYGEPPIERFDLSKLIVDTGSGGSISLVRIETVGS